MTVKEVKNAVIAYGYTYDLEGNDALFLEAMNMAIAEINRVHPVTETAVIVHEPYEPICYDEGIMEYTPGTPLSFSAVACSAVFEVDGAGSVSVEGGTIDGSSICAWNVKTGWRRITVKASTAREIVLHFDGNYLYRIRNIAFYLEALPPTAHVKSGEYVDYDLSELVDDFSAVSCILRNGISYVGEGVYRILHGKVLRLPAADTGTYEVVYETVIPRLADEDEQIPLYSELCILLPILTASYVWLDDNAERAQYYRALYERQAAMIPREKRVSNLIDTKGWS